MSEKINHPSHYQGNGIEVIDVIEAFGLGFNLGNVIKYVLRAGRKGDALEDLQKAVWYLEREIARLQKQATPQPVPEPQSQMQYLDVPIHIDEEALRDTARRWAEKDRAAQIVTMGEPESEPQSADEIGHKIAELVQSAGLNGLNWSERVTVPHLAVIDAIEGNFSIQDTQEIYDQLKAKLG